MKEVMLINVVIYAFSHFDNLTLLSLPDLKEWLVLCSLEVS